MRRALATVGLAIAAACASAPEAPPEEPAAARTWAGHPLTAEWTADGALAVTLTAPTGGHEFVVERTGVADGVATIDCRHTAPGADAIVTQVLTPHRVAVAAAQLAGAKVVQVRIASWTQGVHYVQAPELQLALSLPRP